MCSPARSGQLACLVGAILYSVTLKKRLSFRLLLMPIRKLRELRVLHISPDHLHICHFVLVERIAMLPPPTPRRRCSLRLVSGWKVSTIWSPITRLFVTGDCLRGSVQNAIVAALVFTRQIPALPSHQESLRTRGVPVRQFMLHLTTEPTPPHIVNSAAAPPRAS